VAEVEAAEPETYDGEEEDELPEQPSEDERRVWERAIRRHESVALPQLEMRAQALEARRFVTIAGAQWEGPFGVQWENAPRPEIDKITKSLEKIETDYRENRLTANFVPSDDNSDNETADTLDGMFRADSQHFKAVQAYDNAFQEAIRGGFGAWRITTEYADPDDPDAEDQRINPGMIIVDADQSVFFDPGSKLYDKSDAQWCFVICAYPRADAEEKWGAEACIPWPVSQWKLAWDWYTPDIVKIAEYWEVERVPDRRITLTNALTGETQRYYQSEIEPQEIRDLIAQGWKRTTRKVQRKRIHKYILNGTRVLKDCGLIVGPNIPIVPVYGRRDWVDNMERFRGHVHKKMDRQRIYNSMVAKLVETSATAPRELPIVYPEQLVGSVGGKSIPDIWARANIDRLPFLVLQPVYNEEGQILQGGPVAKIEPPQVQPADAALLQIASSDLTDDDENADEVKANVSAEAMDMAATRVDLKSAIYLDNMRQSHQRGAEIYRDMSPEIYWRPGRRVDTLSMDGKDGSATLAEPYLDANNVFRIRNDLTQGRYKVVADVQESTATKQQKTVRQSLELASAFTQAQSMEDALAALYTASMNMDGEGIRDLQEFYRKRAIGVGAVKPTEEEAAQLAAIQQGSQQPDPAQIALMSQAQELASQAKLNEAKAVQTLADAHLKTAQAEAVGGPVQQPDTPSGLSAANDEAQARERFASADLKQAQAEHLRHDMSIQRIRTGADITQAEHDREMARRQQDLAERQPKEGANG